MTRKEIIKRSFSRAAETYDSCAVIQKEAATLLAKGVVDALSSLALQAQSNGKQGPRQVPNAGRLLDLGCGTGDLLHHLDKRPGFSFACGLDLALPMLEIARKKNRSACVQADIDALPFADSSFDIIASSLAFQWAGDLKAALGEAKRVLKRPRGILALSTLGPKTLGELRASLLNFNREVPVNFIDMDSLNLRFNESGFTILKAETRLIVKTYPDIQALLTILKKTGAQPSLNTGSLGLGIRGRLKEAQELYRKNHAAMDGAIRATYELATIIAINA